MENRENYFILLGLSFDENDEKKIEDRIEKNRKDWDFIKSTDLKAQEYLNQIEEIKRVMLNASSRREESAKAKKMKEEQKSKLKDNLELLALQELSEKEEKKAIKKVYNGVKRYNYSLEECEKLYREIKENIKNHAGTEKKTIIIEFIDETDARQIQENLSKLGMADKDLYTFLFPDGNGNQTAGEMCQAAKKRLLYNQQKGQKDNTRDPLENALCKIVERIFSNEAGKKKYNNYRKVIKYPELNGFIDTSANNKQIKSSARQHLINMAVEKYGMDYGTAVSHIELYAAFKGYSFKEESVICECCGAENPVNSTICTGCGKKLFIICPNCDTRNGNKATKCMKCQFEFSLTEKVNELIMQAKRAFTENSIVKAESILNEAKILWKNHPDLAGLEQQIDEQKKGFETLLRQLDADIKEKRFYSARIKINEAQLKGFTVSTDIVQKVQNKIADVENKLELCRKSSGEQAFSILITLADEISDSKEVSEMLQKYPPKAPAYLNADVKTDNVLLHWEKSVSVGSIEYILVRKQGSRPNHEKDGEVVYKGQHLSYTDTDVVSKKEFYYAIFAVRANVISLPQELKNPVVLVENIKNLKAIGGDGLLTLSWDKAEGISYVEVKICQAEERPSEMSAFTRVDNNRLDGALISGLQNGKKYWICVYAYYEIGGKRYASTGSIIQTIPSKPAKPLEDFDVRIIGNRWVAGWKKSEWDVILLHTSKKPEYTVGMTYDINDILKVYTQLEISLNNSEEGELNLNFTGACYIIPGVVNGTNIILNHPVLISNVPAAKNFTFEKSNAGTQLYADFQWPKKMNQCLLVYRHDTYPKGPDDELAVKVECSKAQYDDNAAIVINKPKEGFYYAAVYIYCDTPEGRIYSEGITASFNNEAQREVYYTMVYKKSLLGKVSFTVTVRSDGAFQFPKFMIVQKKNGIPLNRSDGDVLCSTNEDTEINGSQTFTFQIPALQKGTKLKMFFYNDKHYTQFKIQNDGENTI